MKGLNITQLNVMHTSSSTFAFALLLLQNAVTTSKLSQLYRKHYLLCWLDSLPLSYPLSLELLVSLFSSSAAESTAAASGGYCNEKYRTLY